MRMPPACSGMSVYIEWIKVMSSTHLATSGKMSLTHFPHWPYCLKPKGDGIRPILVFRSVLRSTMAGRSPACLAKKALRVGKAAAVWRGDRRVRAGGISLLNLDDREYATQVVIPSAFTRDAGGLLCQSGTLIAGWGDVKATRLRWIQCSLAGATPHRLRPLWPSRSSDSILHPGYASR